LIIKSVEKFTKFWPSLIVVVSYLACFYFIMLVLRAMPVGITYVIWSGVGIVLVAIISMILYNQSPDLSAVIGMSLILLEVVVIHLFSIRGSH
jgi:small multidrug resistance pump